MTQWKSTGQLNAELYHHGILGQKWGKRNGPPYPLSASDHSASENNDLKVLKSNTSNVTLIKNKDSGLAKLLGRISPKIKNNQKKFSDYSIRDNDDNKIGDIETCIENNGDMNIVWLGIKEKYRGKKYAQNAMQLVIDDARKQGIKRMTLEVPTISPDAKYIYEKIGFVDSGEDMLGDADDVWGGLTKMHMDL